MNFHEFAGYADELDNYNFVRIDRFKKDHKQSSVRLQVDLGELLTELDRLDSHAVAGV